MKETEHSTKGNELNVSHGKKEKLIESNQSNQSNRCNNTFHMERSVALAFRTYAKRHKQSLASLIETALIEYMKKYPLEEVNIKIDYIEPDRLSDIQQRLEVSIMYAEIEKYVEILDRIDKQGKGDYKHFQRKLIDALKPAVKLKDPPKKLLELLKQAESYLDFY